MGRRRVLVLAPVITRMRCMSNPYERIKDAEPRDGKRGFWSWRRKKTVKLGGKRNVGTRRRWGFRVSRLRIRLLSPLFLLKKLRDAYVNMMLSIEQNAGDCGGMVMGAYPTYGLHQPYSSVSWVWPALPAPVMF